MGVHPPEKSGWETALHPLPRMTGGGEYVLKLTSIACRVMGVCSTKHVTLTSSKAPWPEQPHPYRTSGRHSFPSHAQTHMGRYHVAPAFPWKKPSGSSRGDILPPPRVYLKYWTLLRMAARSVHLWDTDRYIMDSNHEAALERCCLFRLQIWK